MASKVHSVELAIIISYPTRASGLIILLKTPPPQKKKKITRTVNIFVDHDILAHKTTPAKTQTLEWQYPVIHCNALQYLIVPKYAHYTLLPSKKVIIIIFIHSFSYPIVGQKTLH